jgi:hypothetical protein
VAWVSRSLDMTTPFTESTGPTISIDHVPDTDVVVSNSARDLVEKGIF